MYENEKTFQSNVPWISEGNKLTERMYKNVDILEFFQPERLVMMNRKNFRARSS